jgi:hypothetical protein
MRNLVVQFLFPDNHHQACFGYNQAAARDTQSPIIGPECIGGSPTAALQYITIGDPENLPEDRRRAFQRCQCGVIMVGEMKIHPLTGAAPETAPASSQLQHFILRERI